MTEQMPNLFGDFEEERIEVPDERLRHDLIDARGHRAGAGAEQKALGGAQGGVWVRRHSHQSSAADASGPGLIIHLK